MRVVFPNIVELANEWLTAKTQVQEDLNRLGKTINNSWQTEHNADGSHANILPDSLTLQGARVGEWIDLPYAATRFFASGSAVWTVQETDVNYLKAMRVGQLVFIMFSFETTVLATDTSDGLFVKLPEFHAIATAGASVALQSWYGGNLEWSDIEHSTSGIGSVSALAQPFATNPTTLLELSRITQTNATFGAWPTSTNLRIGGSVMFPVNADNAALPYSF